MIRSILVPVDGSRFSEHSFPLALSLAQRNGAQLHVVQVHVGLPVGAVEAPEVMFEWEDEVRTQERANLDAAVHELGERGVSVTSALLEGSVVSALADYAGRQKIDMVVMTSHGRGGLSRAWLGSVADALIRFISIPVLITRPGSREPDLSTPVSPARVLIPLDGSVLSESVVQYALDVVDPNTAHFTLLHVSEPAYVLGGAFMAASVLEENAAVKQRLAHDDAYLRRLALSVRTKATMETRVIMHPEPAHAILDFAYEHHFDMIVMATHGRHGFARLALGSVADKVLRGFDKPVLMYRPVMARSSQPKARQFAAVQ
jgi:nucleotide-binding universal stress UspA family protein